MWFSGLSVGLSAFLDLPRLSHPFKFTLVRNLQYSDIIKLSLQTYLVREPEAEIGNISWLFDFRELDLETESVTVRATFENFYTGEVKMELKEDKEQGFSQVLDGG